METFDTQKLDKLLAAYVSAKKSNSRSIAKKRKAQIFQFVASHQTICVADALKSAKSHREKFEVQARTINELATQLHEAELALQRASVSGVSNVSHSDDESTMNAVVRLVIELPPSKCNCQK